jgi:hypothetical protein
VDREDQVPRTLRSSHAASGVLEVWFVGERLANVSEQRYFRACNYDTFQRSDVEKVWTQERHIRIVLTWPVVWPPAERVRFTHRASRLVVKREVEPRQVQ